MNDTNKVYFKKLGLKATAPRLAVLELFQNNKKPLCLNDIRDIITSFDYTTLYRAVNEFLKLGVIKAVNLTSDRAYFEISSEQHHHHISCLECGYIEDVSGCNIESIYAEVLAKTSFKKVKNHSLELIGLCRKCVTKTSM